MSENQDADHLSRLETGIEDEKKDAIRETFPDEQLLVVQQAVVPWYVDFVKYIVSGLFPLEMTSQRRKKFMHEVKFYLWDEPFLYKQCADQIIRRCVPEEEFQSILQHCHSSPYGGHFGGARTAAKVLQSGFY